MNTDEQNVADGIFVDTSVREEIVEWNDKQYTFKVRSIPWMEKQKITSKYMTGKKGGKAQIDLGGMHGDLLMATLVDTGGLFKVSRMNLMKLSDEFGEMLVSRFTETTKAGEEDLKN